MTKCSASRGLLRRIRGCPGRQARPQAGGLNFEQAAVVPVSASTALRGLSDAGQKVLIVGASGGVGTYAVQIAKAFGTEVTGVCSTAKVDLVRSIGADHVIDTPERISPTVLSVTT